MLSLFKKWAVQAFAAAVFTVSGNAYADVSFTLSAGPSVGGTFDLSMFDDGQSVLDGTFTDTTIVIGYDPSLLQLLSVGPGSAFGSVSASLFPVTVSGYEAIALSVTRTSPAASYGSDIVTLSFMALAAGPTDVLIMTLDPEPTVPNYFYSMSDGQGGNGYLVPLTVAVPEPETWALALAAVFTLGVGRRQWVRTGAQA